MLEINHKMFLLLVPFSSVVAYALEFNLASAHISSMSKAKEQNHISEDNNNHWRDQEIFMFFWNPKVYYHFHMSSPLILLQIEFLQEMDVWFLFIWYVVYASGQRWVTSAS